MGAWTSYAQDHMLYVATGAEPAPTLWVALYSTSANPSGSPAELTLGGYARQQVGFVNDAASQVATTYDLVFGPLGAGSYLGLGILDSSSGGNLWFWDDEPSSVTIPAASNVTIPAASLTLTRTG